MFHRVERAIERHHMFEPGFHVGVAVSGGADSLFLLHVLHELAPRWNLHLSVLHIDHGLRGEASRQDAEFVRQAAARFALPFLLRQTAVAEIEGNLEQAARHVRHGFYRELIAAGTLHRVATGHTLSDQAETVLYRLLRGSGLAGLCGVLPVTREGLVRPLLDLSRAEIVAWLQQHGIEWREDETNQSRAFDRNRLRHEILPLLRETFNPRLDEILAHLATLAQDEEEYWNLQILPHQPVPGPRRAAWILRTAELTSIHPALARRIIRRALAEIKGDLRQIDFSHVETILEMARASQGSNRVQLPGLDVYRSFDWIRIAPASPAGARERDFDLPVNVPGSVTLPGGTRTLTFQLIRCEENRQSYDKLRDELDWECLTYLSEPVEAGSGSANSGRLVLRNWRPGDHYRPAGQSQDQKIKFFFQEARIPLWDRRDWPVLTCRETIVWSRQFGPAADLACSPATRTILRIGEEVCLES